MTGIRTQKDDSRRYPAIPFCHHSLLLPHLGLLSSGTPLSRGSLSSQARRAHPQHDYGVFDAPDTHSVYPRLVGQGIWSWSHSPPVNLLYSIAHQLARGGVAQIGANSSARLWVLRHTGNPNGRRIRSGLCNIGIRHCGGRYYLLHP